MPLSHFPRIAVVADAHFHDIYGDYRVDGVEDGMKRLSLRLLADAARATRIFNESYFALHRALDDIAERGIRHVVLLGDYSDDGQIETVASVKRVLNSYVERFGMRFYATVGNHDIFGADGRHRTKRFLNADGGYDLATSDPQRQDPQARSVRLSDEMYCRGYPGGLDAMADFGFYPSAGDLHWETPFGKSGDPRERHYEVRSPDGKTVRRLMDASYLVEPFDGVWLMMIDANVFEPVDGVSPGEEGDLADSTSAGWNAMLHHKRFVLDWIADVSRRARESGKCLLAFSHYPALDPLDGTLEDELALLGRTGMSERIPRGDVATALMDAGMRVHFSGHLHINDTARHGRDEAFLVNIAVPSLVAFPSAYKIVSVAERKLTIETADIGAMKLDDGLMRCYAMEITRSGLKAGGMMAAENYGEFLFEHLGHLVGRRNLKREWPPALAALMRTLDLADLAALALVEHPVIVEHAAAAAAAARSDVGLQAKLPVALRRSGNGEMSTAMDFLRDWYRLRMASDLADGWISAERMQLYASVSALYRKQAGTDPRSVQARFARLFRMFERYASGLPSDHFTIDRETGAIERL